MRLRWLPLCGLCNVEYRKDSNPLTILQISAQESRRKKKEYMDQLERRVEDLADENRRYRRKLDNLTSVNYKLSSELRALQGTVARGEKTVNRATPTATLL